MWSKRFPFSVTDVSTGLNIKIEEVRLYVLSGDLKEYTLAPSIEGYAAGYHRYTDILNFISQREMEKSDICKDLFFDGFPTNLLDIPHLDLIMRSAPIDGNAVKWLDRQLQIITMKEMSKKETSEFRFESYALATRIFAENILLSYGRFFRIYCAHMSLPL